MNGKATAFAMSGTQAVLAVRPSDDGSVPYLQIMSVAGTAVVCGADAIKALRSAISYALGEEPRND